MIDHSALQVTDVLTSRAFYEAVLAPLGINAHAADGPAVGFHGAEALHAPRVIPGYHEHYYGAFLLDPDGPNIEAVCHTPSA